MWQNLHIFITILVCISCIGITAWILRPGSKKTYSEYEKIPIKNDEN